VSSWNDRALDERTLAVDALARRVFARLAEKGCDAVLLKGRSVAAALYGPGESRGVSVDVDVLAAPEDAGAVAETLVELGYAPRPYRSPGDHATTWVREGLPDVDVHETLAGLLADPEAVWAALREHREELAVGRLPVLDRPGLALHLALHAAQHGRQGGRPLRDLARAVERIDEAHWREAAQLADRLGGTETFGAGLRLLPEGRALAARLGVPPTRSLLAGARADGAPTGARFVASALDRGGLRAVLWAVAPPPAVMRSWYPDSSLPAAYLRRPVRVVRRAPAIVRRVWVARRRSRALT
jgi:hypothetical protein